MSSERKKRLVLIALAVVMAFVAWRQLAPYVAKIGSGTTRPSSAGRAGRGGADEASPLPEVVDLRLDDLEMEPDQFSSERDPFRFGVERKPPPEPPKQDSESAMRRALREAKEREQQDLAPRMPAAPKPPPVDVVFLGSFGPQDRKLAVFSDGSDIFNVFEGDQLNEKFYVVKIGLESADIGFVAFPDAPAQRLEVGG